MTWVMIERVLAMVAMLLGGHRALGTVFGSSRWDASNPHSRLACYHRQIDDARDALVAHNTLPCRSQLLLYNPRTHRSTLARVGDRGPLHAGIDLSKLVARRLQHNGFEDVVIIPLGTAAPAQPGPSPMVAAALPAARPRPLTPAELRKQLQAAAEQGRVPAMIEAMADVPPPQ